MNLKGKKIGVAFTGSFCTYEKAFLALEKLVGKGQRYSPFFRRRQRALTAVSEMQRIL